MNTKEEILKLKEAVNKLAKEFGMHSDGDGVNPHQLATEISNGLMSADTYRQARGYAYKDNYLNEKYDFWRIPPGIYATVYAWADLIPVPDDAVPGDLITLKVFGEDNRRKTYIMIIQKTGSIYYLNTSQNKGEGGGNTNSLLWKRIPQETILWNAGTSDATVGQNMNLAVSTRRFRRLRFHFHGLGGSSFCVDVPAHDNPIVSFSTTASSANEAYIIRMNFVNQRDNIVLRYDKLRVTTLRPDGTITIDDNDRGFTIFAIEGVY